MKDEKKLSFWNKLKFSIFDFEKYQELAAEKIGKTILYLVIIMIVFAIVVAGIYTYRFVETVGDVRQFIDDNIETITFEDNRLRIEMKNHENVTRIDNEELGIKVIISTNNFIEEEKNNRIEELKSSGNGILILDDKVMIKNEIMNTPYTYQYQTIAEAYNINFLDKQEVLNMLSSDNIKPFIAIFFVIMLIYMFIIYLSSALVDAIILSLFGYLVSIITRIRLKFSATYNIAVYSLTLPIILNLIYFVINSFTGFTIKYFDIMYTTVATIYIATAILLIRSDIIKQQIELTKIIEEQDKVREELRRKEEERKEQEEKERQKREDEDKRKKKEKDKEDKGIGEEPEGDNV